MAILKKLDEILVFATQVFCGILLLLIVAICFVSTVARYVFNNPFIWAEEVMRFMSIWLVLVGSSLTCRADGHTTLDLLQEVIIKNRKVKAVFFVTTRALCVLVLILLFPHSLEMVKVLGYAPASATRVPMAVLYTSFPVGAVLMIIGYLRAIPKFVRELLEGDKKNEIVEGDEAS